MRPLTKRDQRIMRERKLERIALAYVWKHYCECNDAHDLSAANTKEQFEEWLLEKEVK